MRKKFFYITQQEPSHPPLATTLMLKWKVGYYLLLLLIYLVVFFIYIYKDTQIPDGKSKSCMYHMYPSALTLFTHKICSEKVLFEMTMIFTSQFST